MIRDFLGKLEKVRCRLGIIFSRNGITGEQRGEDAVREIHSAYDRNQTSIIVVSADDLAGPMTPADFLQLLEAKLDALRFDR